MSLTDGYKKRAAVRSVLCTDTLECCEGIKTAHADLPFELTMVFAYHKDIIFAGVTQPDIGGHWRTSTDIFNVSLLWRKGSYGGIFIFFPYISFTCDFIRKTSIILRPPYSKGERLPCAPRHCCSFHKKKPMRVTPHELSMPFAQCNNTTLTDVPQRANGCHEVPKGDNLLLSVAIITIPCHLLRHNTTWHDIVRQRVTTFSFRPL